MLERQNDLDGARGYCLARRVINQIYYESSTDLLCVGQGNQCSPGACMITSFKVFAGKGKDGIPPEFVSAMCKY